MFGADIEFFCKDKKGDVIPICGKIGGTKDKPIKIDESYSILEDGAAVELNYTPADNATMFASQIQASKDVIKKFTGLDVVDMPEAVIDGIQEFKQAMEIGCDPDFWAYDKGDPTVERPIPDIRQFGRRRFAGGHIHLSYEIADKIPAWVVARFIDLYVTIPTLSYVAGEFGGKESAPLSNMQGPYRRKHYGMAGLHRPKPYGVEYRTLSNYWALVPKITQRLVYHLNMFRPRLTEKNMERLNEDFLAVDWDKVERAITLLDVPKIHELSLYAAGR